ncbi:hypothetical protein KIW84_015877 [Lathyrus oleraceus]|uniref:Lysosomal Pro-X carboxypeptidase n=1 Tax=Pisum sativum TaxID=3888 RepID=A0A9D5H1F6_PEA|nr:hypothetical protein KIW84_015877 [Pisum sativum]
MTDNATSFKALLVYIEHRYYGNSVPFGSEEEAFKNATTLGYLDSAQALVDYGDVVIHIQETLQMQNSPIIVIGGSYGGMLASWFRLKYPHLAIGALASSAPILYIDDVVQPNAYMDIVSADFKLSVHSCPLLVGWDDMGNLRTLRPNLLRVCEKISVCLDPQWNFRTLIAAIHTGFRQLGGRRMKVRKVEYRCSYTLLTDASPDGTYMYYLDRIENDEDVQSMFSAHSG